MQQGYVDAVNDVCKHLTSNNEPLETTGEILAQEILDDLRNQNKLTQGEYETLFANYCPE